MRRVVNISSATSQFIPELEFLPTEGSRIKAKIAENQLHCEHIFNPFEPQVYWVEDNAGLVHALTLINFTMPPPGGIIEATVGDLQPYYHLRSAYAPWIRNKPKKKSEESNRNNQHQLQQIKSLLENKTVMFLDVNTLESLIGSLDDSELNHLCSGRVFN